LRVVGLLGWLLWVGCWVSWRCSLWGGGRRTWWRSGVWGWLSLLWWLGWSGPIVRVFAGGDGGEGAGNGGSDTTGVL